MPDFTNYATITYNGNTINSNIVTGQLQEVIEATKTAVTANYIAGDDVTYVINIVNSGATDYNGLTVTDNLGRYAFGEGFVYPLTYVTGSVLYYKNGILQTSPTVTATATSLVFSDISVPANGNISLIYEVKVNQFAPLGIDGRITNVAVVTGNGISTTIQAEEVIDTENAANLSITKNLNPTTIVENGTVTYTFTIQNVGNTAATTGVVITDTFLPIIDITDVKFNGTDWVDPTNYSYVTETGVFTTEADQVTVPAATYEVNNDGSTIVKPGVSTLVITAIV